MKRKILNMLNIQHPCYQSLFVHIATYSLPPWYIHVEEMKNAAIVWSDKEVIQV